HRRVLRHHSDLALAALDVAEPHLTIDLGDRGGILRTTRLEQLGDAGQTTGDVARLVSLARNLGDDRTGRDLLPILNCELCTDGDDEIAEALFLTALRLNDLDVRVQLLFLVFDDDGLTETGELVELLGNRLARNQVDEAQGSFHVRDDRVGVRVPAEDDLILLHLFAVLHHQGCAQRNLETRADRAAAIAAALDGELAFVRGDDLLSLAVGDDDESVAKLDRSRHLRLARRLLGDTSRGSTDVEGAERQLSSRLADRPRGDDSDCLTLIDHGHGRQVAAIAHLAETALRLTGENAADLHRFETGLFDAASHVFVDELTSLDQQRALAGLVDFVNIIDVLGSDGSYNSLGQWLDDVLAFLQRSDFEAEDGSAIFLGDRHILRDVDEAAGEVTGVRRFQSGVGQTLTSSVGRDEVLEHGQTFTEVRLDRALDDFADTTGELLLRLGHQSAHTGELTDLVARSTGAGIEHHEHRVEALLRLAHRLDHLVGDVGVRVRPGVDDFVVALAV